MRGKLSWMTVVTACIIIVGLASAQVKEIDQIGQRIAPPTFQDLPDGFDYCSEPGLPIPDLNSTSDAIVIEDNPLPVEGLELVLQIDHTWVGDLQVELAYVEPGGDVVVPVLIVDRPGVPATAAGCSGDDIDAILSDDGSVSIEDVCEPVVPTIAGIVSPSPSPMSTFDFASAEGTWLLFVQDNAAGDTGTLVAWCLNLPAPPDGPGEPTPATSAWGIAALVVLFLVTSVFFLRRRSRA